MISFKIKIILFLTVLVIDKCSSKARTVFTVPEDSYDPSYGVDDDHFPNYQKNYDEPSMQYPSCDHNTYIPPKRNVSNGAEVVKASEAKYLARLFSICGESDFTATVCMCIIIAPDTCITAAHCVYGQNFFQICTRKPGETKCPSRYDETDKNNCFKPDDVYIHPGFVGSLRKGTLCDDLAVLTWNKPVFDFNQVLQVDFERDCCLNGFCEEGKNGTVVGCGNKIDTQMVFFRNRLLEQREGVDAYGKKWLQCSTIYTDRDAFQTEFPSVGYAGSPLFVLNTNYNESYDPNVDPLNAAKLLGLGSFFGRKNKPPYGFVALCDYKLFLSNPKFYGTPIANANKELEGFPLAEVIELLQTILLDGAYISCTLQRVVRTLSGLLGLVDTVEDVLTGRLLTSLVL